MPDFFKNRFVLIFLVIVIIVLGIYLFLSDQTSNTPAHISDKECWPVAFASCGPKLYSGLSLNPCDHNYLFTRSAVLQFQGQIIDQDKFKELGTYLDLSNPPGRCSRPICFGRKLPIGFWNIVIISTFALVILWIIHPIKKIFKEIYISRRNFQNEANS